jgi:hypothetical protein
MAKHNAPPMPCRKVAYNSLKAARIALRNHTGSFAVMHAYRCDRCFRFHIGHRDERAKRS